MLEYQSATKTKDFLNPEALSYCGADSESILSFACWNGAFY